MTGFDDRKGKRPWLTSDEAAEYLRISRKALYAAVSRRQIRAHRLGKRLRFRPQELDAALQ